LQWPYPDKIKPKIFTLQGAEARDFAHSILLENRFFGGSRTSTVYNINETHCEFYRGSLWIASLVFKGSGNSVRLGGTTTGGYPALYPFSSLHIYRIFEERAKSVAK